MEYRFNLKVEMPMGYDGQIPLKVLEVDKELRPELVKKTLHVEDGVLHVAIEADDPKVLRVAVSSFFDYLILTYRTIMECA